jgi:hypothetical protein
MKKTTFLATTVLAAETVLTAGFVILLGSVQVSAPTRPRTFASKPMCWKYIHPKVCPPEILKIQISNVNFRGLEITEGRSPTGAPEP